MHQLLIQVLEFGPCDTWIVHYLFFISQRDEEAEISFSLFLPTPRRLAQVAVPHRQWRIASVVSNYSPLAHGRVLRYSFLIGISFLGTFCSH